MRISDWSSDVCSSDLKNGTTVFLLDEDGDLFITGGMMLNEFANAKSVIGLTVNQGGNDDEILSLKSSDVGHGGTSITENDTYAYAKKYAATTGGLLLEGVRASGTAGPGLALAGTNPSLDTTHTTAGRADRTSTRLNSSH